MADIHSEIPRVFWEKFDMGPKPIPWLFKYVKHVRFFFYPSWFYLQLTGAPAGGEEPRLQGMRYNLWANCTAEVLGDLLCIIEMGCSIDY